MRVAVITGVILNVESRLIVYNVLAEDGMLEDGARSLLLGWCQRFVELRCQYCCRGLRE